MSKTAMPTAVVRPQRRLSVLWIVPIGAVMLACWLGYRGWVDRGVAISIELDQGHGLKPGDAVRFRGISVGTIRAVELAEDQSSIEVTASLRREAAGVARVGSRFWVVRPQLRLTGVAGLETLIGPRYLAVLPGAGAAQREFVGLPAPPVVESINAGDLEVIVKATHRGSLTRGAPVFYRQVTIGAVLSVGLTSDAGAVEARLHIEQQYAQLICEHTEFWDAGGVEASLGLTGVNVEVESLETMITGGVGVATPPDAGPNVHTGHRFALAGEPPDDWAEWEPLVSIGSELLPPGATLPAPMHARLGWRQDFAFIPTTRSRYGRVLQTFAGLLGPHDLLVPGDKAEDGTAALEVAGTVVALDQPLAWRGHGLALLDRQVAEHPWPQQRCRTPEAPEDCLVVADANAPPQPLSAARFNVIGDGQWSVDPAVSLDDAWHGAAVVARTDGALVGLLLVDDDELRVGLVPPSK